MTSRVADAPSADGPGPLDTDPSVLLMVKPDQEIKIIQLPMMGIGPADFTLCACRPTYFFHLVPGPRGCAPFWGFQRSLALQPGSADVVCRGQRRRERWRDDRD